MLLKNKKIIKILVALLFLSVFVGFCYYFKSTIRNKDQKLLDAKVRIAKLGSEKITLEKQLAIMDKKLVSALKNSEELSNKIDALKKENNALKNSVYRKNKELKQVREELNTMSRQYTYEATELDLSNEEKRRLQQQINEREHEASQLNSQLSSLKNKLAKKDKDYEALEYIKGELVDDIDSLHTQQIIIANTNIKMLSAQIMNKNGKMINKLSEEGRNWQNSKFYIQILNTTFSAILDKKYFAVEIYDMDNGIPLPKREGNPISPGKNSLIYFELNNKGRIDLDFVNYQVKTGKNYYLRLYYIPNRNRTNERFLCGEGTQFIFNRKIISI